MLTTQMLTTNRVPASRRALEARGSFTFDTGPYPAARLRPLPVPLPGRHD